MFLVFVVVAFVRGLETSLAASGDPRVALVYSIGAAEDVENSPSRPASRHLLSASLEGIERRYGVSYVSPELYVGNTDPGERRRRPLQAVIRGVTPAAPLVRRQVQMIDGKWPGSGEILAGRLAAAKLGCAAAALAIGNTVTLDGRPVADQRPFCRRRRCLRVGIVVSAGRPSAGHEAAGLEPCGRGTGQRRIGF